MQLLIVFDTIAG